MPFARPPLTALRQQGLQDILASDIVDPTTGASGNGLLQKSVLGVLSWVVAGLTYLLYGYLDWISRNSTPWGATGEFAAAWGALVNEFQFDATPAGAPAIAWTGADPTPIPAGTELQRLDGIQYVTTADATISGGTTNLAIQAVAAGSAGNAPTGTLLRLVTPLAGISPQATTTVPITGGTDVETIDDFKVRYLAKYAAPPQGGDQQDYVVWARDVPGVTRAWCVPNGMGAGTVFVYVMFDEAEAAFGGFPQGTTGVATDEPRDVAATGDQLAVANSIFPKQPVTALVYVGGPVAAPTNFTVDELGAGNTAPNRAAITAALDGMFLQNADAQGGTIYPNRWEEAIAAIPGLTQFRVSVPSAAITAAVGHLPTRGTMTFNT